MNRVSVANFLILKKSHCGFLESRDTTFRNFSYIKPQRIELQLNATQHIFDMYVKTGVYEEVIRGGLDSFFMDGKVLDSFVNSPKDRS